MKIAHTFFSETNSIPTYFINFITEVDSKLLSFFLILLCFLYYGIISFQISYVQMFFA
jgi:hypothetical protein